jgi:phage baseplate assembly protein W
LAYIDKSKTGKTLPDLDELQSLGFKLPVEFDGDAMTLDTLEAIKVNLRSLISTETGERLMQPNLGARLKRFLFEPFSDDMIMEIKAVIHESINLWLPFLNITNIQVNMSTLSDGESFNTLDITIDFNLKRNSAMLDSVQVTVG